VLGDGVKVASEVVQIISGQAGHSTSRQGVVGSVVVVLVEELVVLVVVLETVVGEVVVVIAGVVAWLETGMLRRTEIVVELSWAYAISGFPSLLKSAIILYHEILYQQYKKQRAGKFYLLSLSVLQLCLSHNWC
ncbi:hypothetical protein MHYMCMPSP_00013, partial [Hyalomma marginatum]